MSKFATVCRNSVEKLQLDAAPTFLTHDAAVCASLLLCAVHGCVIEDPPSLDACACVVGKERPPKFIAGIILSRKNSTFLRLVHESYRNDYRGADWDYNCARVPYQLYLAHPDLLHVEPYKFTTPDWTERYDLWNRVIDWRELYVVHIMAHYDVRQTYTPESIMTMNNTFGEVMRYIYYGSPKLIRPTSWVLQLPRKFPAWGKDSWIASMGSL